MKVKVDIRSVACVLAKVLADERGGHPREHMKEAWKEAKEKPWALFIHGVKSENDRKN